MRIENALTNARLTMEGDALPKNDRKVNTVQQLIAAARAAEALEKLTDDNWRLLVEEHPHMVKRLTTACESLAALLRKGQQ